MFSSKFDREREGGGGESEIDRETFSEKKERKIEKERGGGGEKGDDMR